MIYVDIKSILPLATFTKGQPIVYQIVGPFSFTTLIPYLLQRIYSFFVYKSIIISFPNTYGEPQSYAVNKNKIVS